MLLPYLTSFIFKFGEDVVVVSRVGVARVVGAWVRAVISNFFKPLAPLRRPRASP